MYSRKSWGGPVDPYILVKFEHPEVPEGQDPIVSLVIFEWADRPLIGKPDPNDKTVVWAQIKAGMGHNGLMVIRMTSCAMKRLAMLDSARKPILDPLFWPPMLLHSHRR